MFVSAVITESALVFEKELTDHLVKYQNITVIQHDKICVPCQCRGQGPRRESSQSPHVT